MELPLIVSKNLDEYYVKKWEDYYKNPTNDWNRKIEEGLWRRTQEFNTRRQSGWKTLNDKRRRMVHYLHNYELLNNEDGTKDLALVSTYLWIHLCFPDSEIKEYCQYIRDGLKLGNWTKGKVYRDDLGNHEIYSRGKLQYKLSFMDKHIQDIQHNRTFPQEYRILEITVNSVGYPITDEIVRKPWQVFNRGQRRKDFRGNPYVSDNIENINEFLPAQVELGCGPSIEAGIPPLNFLHEVYSVTEKKTNKFILGSKDDKLAYNVARYTEKTYELFTYMYKTCFFSKPTKFHKILKLLHDKQLVVGSIITNNFDGLPLNLGIEERYVRRYEEQHIIPEIHFHPEAKSLFVIGSHADRRKIHAAARKKGLKLVYIDPEGYFEGGNFVPYKLEDPQDGDFVFRESSINAFEKILEKLIQEGIINANEVSHL